MNKREAILFLEKKRDKAIGYLNFFGEGSKESLMNEIRVNTYDIAINKLEQIDEPQGEKVEVPSCMGTFLDRYPDKKETAMHIIMHDFCESKYFDEFAEFPLADYPMGWDRLMASALMFGYTVKPKRWVVKRADKFFEKFYGYGLRGTWAIHQNQAYLFDDKSKAEAVATLVEGSVEEV